MKLKIVIYPRLEILTKEIKDKSRISVRELIRLLGYREYEVVVSKFSNVLSPDDYLSDGDIVHIYEVISTG